MGIAKQSSNPISRVPSLPHLSIIGRCLSFIYITSHLATKAFYPPLCLRLGGLPSNNGLHELAAPERHSQTITRLLVVSYTTFSPLPHITAWRLFSSTYIYCHQQLLFSEAGCPMLPGLSSRIHYRCQRQSRNTALSECKDNGKHGKAKIFQ